MINVLCSRYKYFQSFRDYESRRLRSMGVGDSVVVQNQTGNYPSRWDITGVVVEVREHDQYVIKVDGSGRMTLRNRKFLQKMTQYQNLT